MLKPANYSNLENYAFDANYSNLENYAFDANYSNLENYAFDANYSNLENYAFDANYSNLENYAHGLPINKIAPTLCIYEIFRCVERPKRACNGSNKQETL
jgi:hypothetical protein